VAWFVYAEVGLMADQFWYIGEVISTGERFAIPDPWPEFGEAIELPGDASEKRIVAAGDYRRIAGPIAEDEVGAWLE
jgi:hypothetical protein